MKVNSIFLFSIFVIIVMIIDSTIVKTFGYSNSRIPGTFDTLLFLVFVAVFIISNFLILNTTKNIKIYSIIKKLYPVIVVNQSIIAAILVLIIIQMNLYSYYDRNLFLSVVYFSCISSVLFSVFLVIKLFQWFKYHQNYIILLYGIAFSLLVGKSLIGVIYVTQEILNHSITVVPSETRRMIMNLSNVNATLSNILKNTYYYTSILSYILIWITTVLLLRQYSNKFGKFKYWVLVSVPLIYFFTQDRIVLISFFNSIILSSPNLFGIIHTLFFSAVQLVGGTLFGIGFFISAKKINREKISNPLIISGIGIIILIGSTEIFGVYVGAYPPYGLVTISFMGLASYLLLSGILLSAILIANNIQIRKELYKMVDNQPALFRDIGSSEMESEREKHVKKLMKSTSNLTKQYDEDYEYDEEETRKYIKDVLAELQEKNKFEK
jgi:hypothetical protein